MRRCFSIVPPPLYLRLGCENFIISAFFFLSWKFWTCSVASIAEIFVFFWAQICYRNRSTSYLLKISLWTKQTMSDVRWFYEIFSIQMRDTHNVKNTRKAFSCWFFFRIESFYLRKFADFLSPQFDLNRVAQSKEWFRMGDDKRGFSRSCFREDLGSVLRYLAMKFEDNVLGMHEICFFHSTMPFRKHL